MNYNVYPLIMAGGRGTRFWPESTSKTPKQYLNLTGESSLLGETLTRFDGFADKKFRHVVTVKEQEELVLQSSSGLIDDNGIIFEPSGRNTAPCILLSLVSLLSKGASSQDVVVIVPSDHVILNKTGFQEVLQSAVEASKKQKKIVTIGITPNFPHTGYGYIHRGVSIENDSFDVESFKEKPSFDIAKKYVESGNYYWNAGMFVSSIETLLGELEKHAPEIYKYKDDLFKNINDFTKLTEVYNEIPRESIDYAVMEKSKNVIVIPSKFDWNDLGSWDAMEDVLDNIDNNTIVKGEKHYFDNSKGNIVFSPNQFVSLINVDDLIVISNDNSLVVLPKKDSQKVKDIVSFLETKEWGKELL